MLSGYEVNERDRVWDVLNGWGTVVAVNPDGTFNVTFGSTGETVYQPGGYRGASSKQRLFWQDMTTISSPKKGEEGKNEVRLINATLAHLRAFGDLSAPVGESDNG